MPHVEIVRELNTQLKLAAQLGDRSNFDDMMSLLITCPSFLTWSQKVHLDIFFSFSFRLTHHSGMQQNYSFTSRLGEHPVMTSHN